MFDVTEVAQGGSAGSVTLIFQALLLPLVFAAGRSQLTLKGGTHVAWSPPFDYLTSVFLPVLACLGIETTCSLDAWGFYPVGGGQMRAMVTGVGAVDGAGDASEGHNMRGIPPRYPHLKPLILTERGQIQRVQGVAVACNLPAHIAQRMANRAGNVLRQAGVAADIVPKRVRGSGPGAGIFLTAEYEHTLAGFSALGRKGKPAEAVADEACRDLLTYNADSAAVDKHLADQLLLPLALVRGRSQFRTEQISHHLLTNAHVIRQFIPAQIEIEGNEGETGEVFVEGAGKAIEW
jgi:RNA 3'-terminal phosphate cyclase (ATP)